MRILQECSNIFRSVFPTLDISREIFVASKFNFYIPREYGYVLVNTFSRCIAEIDENEYIILHSNDISSRVRDFPAFLQECADNRMIVEKGTDETKNYLEYYDLLYSLKANHGKSFYKIFTTTACNARCFYCFENGIKVQTMNDETADALVKYIINTHCRDRVNLYWFGGEPLCNHRIITHICKGLSANNIDYLSYIVTNGILFDDTLVKEAMDLWHLDRCQITLDGMHDEYKKRKNYKFDYENPLEIVLNNIEKLADANIRRLDIRLNTDVNNIDSILLLKEYLKKRFGGRDNISVYPAPIMDTWFDYNDDHSNEKRNDLFAAWSLIRDEVEQDGLRAASKFSKEVPLSYCMASNTYSVIVSADGKLYTCENYSDDFEYGDLWNGITNEALYQKWTHPMSINEKCIDCSLLPECTPFHLCPSGYNGCYKKREDQLIRKIRGTF